MSGFGVGLSLQTCTVWKATASCASGRTNPLSAFKIRPCHYNKYRTSQRTPFLYSQIQSHPIILSFRLQTSLPGVAKSKPRGQHSVFLMFEMTWLCFLQPSLAEAVVCSSAPRNGKTQRNGHSCPFHHPNAWPSFPWIANAICNQMYWGVTRETIFGAARNHNPSNGSFHA